MITILCECSHLREEHECNVDWTEKFPGLNVPDEYVGTCKKCKCEKYKYEVPWMPPSGGSF